jgi:hypothetical protein
MLVSALRLFALKMSNPLSRRILKLGAKKNPDGSSRVESAVSLFAGGKRASGVGDWIYCLAIQAVSRGIIWSPYVCWAQSKSNLDRASR